MLINTNGLKWQNIDKIKYPFNLIIYINNCYNEQKCWMKCSSFIRLWWYFIWSKPLWVEVLVKMMYVYCLFSDWLVHILFNINCIIFLRYANFQINENTNFHKKTFHKQYSISMTKASFCWTNFCFRTLCFHSFGVCL